MNTEAQYSHTSYFSINSIVMLNGDEQRALSYASLQSNLGERNWCCAASTMVATPCRGENCAITS